MMALQSLESSVWYGVAAALKATSVGPGNDD